MHRYWIVLGRIGSNQSIGLPWWGITARDRADALLQLTQALGTLDYDVKEMTEDVQMHELDQKHVVPNMGNPFRRGVWYPAIDGQWPQR